MLDYLFQHFYSTLAIFSFCIAILILRALGKRSSFWIPVSTAPLGCITFLAVFLLLTAVIIGTFGFFTTIPIAENLAFALAWLAAMSAALAVISRLTGYYLRQEPSAGRHYPEEYGKIMSAQLRNKGILLFAIIGIISCAIDIITLPFPIPELPPGSPLSAATMIPLPPEVPLKYASPPVSRPGFPENAILTRPSGKGWRQTRFPRHFDQSRREKRRYHLQAVAGGQASSGQPDFH